MRKFLLTIFLTAGICFAADWSRYYINNGDSPYLWIVAPVEMLQTSIPEGLPWSTVSIGEDVEGNPQTRQKTLEEYTFPHMRHDLGDGTVLFLVRAMAGPVQRPYKFTDADADRWAAHFASYGYTNFLTTAAARELMPEVRQ